MINMATILKAVVNQLKSHADTNGYTIERSAEVNGDPGVDWVGVYKGNVSYGPGALGRGARNWIAVPTVRVVAQAFTDDAEDTDDLLEAKLNNIFNALESDRTFGGAVGQVVGYSVEYSYTGTDFADIPFQTGIIIITIDKRA